MSQPFEVIKGVNPTGSSRKEGSSAGPPVTGSIYSADSKGRPTGHAPSRAYTSSYSRGTSGTTPVTNTGKQSTQTTGSTQHTGATSKFYGNQSRESLYAPSLGPTLTRSTDSGDTSRRSVGYPQTRGEDPTPLPAPGSSVPPVSRTGNPPTHAAERGRQTQTSNAADTTLRRESSSTRSEDSSGAETSDDEDPDQTPVNYGQSDDSPALSGRRSGGIVVSDGNVQLTQAVRRDQLTKATNPAVAPPSRESSPSPPLSEDISAAGSLNSEDSIQSSSNNVSPKEPRTFLNPGRGNTREATEPFRQLTETQEYDHSLNVSGPPDVYSSMTTPHAPLTNLPVAASVNSKDTGEDSPSLDPPIELLSLTDLGSGGSAATEAAQYLVQAVGRDVVSFRRNTQVSYMVVERARDIVKAINEYIAKVESSATGDWDSFEKFTVAIVPLEE